MPNAHSENGYRNTMKTPRDLLMEQHRAAGPKLDSLRRNTVARLSDRTSAAPGNLTHQMGSLRKWVGLLWRELIFPCRRTWTGLAAVWVMLYLINLGQRDQTYDSVRKQSSAAAETLLVWRQQERLLAEWAESPRAIEAVPRLPSASRPRTDRSTRLLTA